MALNEDAAKQNQRVASYSPVTHVGCRMQAWLEGPAANPSTQAMTARAAESGSHREEEDPERWDGMS